MYLCYYNRNNTAIAMILYVMNETENICNMLQKCTDVGMVMFINIQVENKVCTKLICCTV